MADRGHTMASQALGAKPARRLVSRVSPSTICVARPSPGWPLLGAQRRRSRPSPDTLVPRFEASSISTTSTAIRSSWRMRSESSKREQNVQTLVQTVQTFHHEERKLSNYFKWLGD